ncbi:MAG: hypothetical protein ACFE95_17460 [Candidatus Hodarchaeota archaeon]
MSGIGVKEISLTISHFLMEHKEVRVYYQRYTTLKILTPLN